MTATDTLPDTMTPEFYEEHQPLAASIAATNWKRSAIFTSDDVEQAIWEHVLANWRHYREASVDSIATYMKRAARGFARKERNDYMYFTGAFIYTPKIVAAYLDTCAWQPIEEVPDIDARVDMQEAFALLRERAPKQAAAVYKRYALGETALSGAEKFNLSAGVESLTHRLNSGLRLQAESIDLTSSKEN